MKPATPLTDAFYKTIPETCDTEADAKNMRKFGDFARKLETDRARLVEALKELVKRCDGDEGVRADGSNIQTIAAHAILGELGEL